MSSENKDQPYVPRFSFEISEDLRDRANKLLSTHGIRKAVMTPILIDLLDMIEEHGQMVVGVLIGEGLKPREAIKSMAKAERKSSNG
jgi:hypothetical protein